MLKLLKINCERANIDNCHLSIFLPYIDVASSAMIFQSKLKYLMIFNSTLFPDSGSIREETTIVNTKYNTKQLKRQLYQYFLIGDWDCTTLLLGTTA